MTFSKLLKKQFKIRCIYVESDSKELNKIDPDLIISIGGDGTALKAMRVAWEKNTSLITIGPGRLGYLVSSSENLGNILKSWKNEDYDVVKRKAIIQNNDLSLPAFNEVVIIKNSPTRILDLELSMYGQKVKLRADGLIYQLHLALLHTITLLVVQLFKII